MVFFFFSPKGTGNRIDDFIEVLPQTLPELCVNENVTRAILETACIDFKMDLLSPNEICRYELHIDFWLHWPKASELLSWRCVRLVSVNSPFHQLPDDKTLDGSKLKQSADNNFKFDENSRKFSRRLENTVGKGEIACYEQFLLFPPCFQKACFPGASKGVIV